MKNISEITLIGLFFGMLGTTVGGIIGAFLNVKTKKYMCFILEFAAGLMTSIICFDLVPESLNYGNITICIIGMFLGIIGMIICNKVIKDINKKKQNSNNLLETGFIVFLGLTIHNFPEGLAIGSGFDASTTLGFSLALAIAIHDIPEGISISLPLNKGGISKINAILLTAISGITTGIGAFLGAIIGNISQYLISISLAFAGGAMLYIVSCELIPESKSMYKGRFNSIGNMIGIIFGIIAHVCI